MVGKLIDLCAKHRYLVLLAYVCIAFGAYFSLKKVKQIFRSVTEKHDEEM